MQLITDPNNDPTAKSQYKLWIGKKYEFMSTNKLTMHVLPIEKYMASSERISIIVFFLLIPCLDIETTGFLIMPLL